MLRPGEVQGRPLRLRSARGQVQVNAALRSEQPRGELHDALARLAIVVAGEGAAERLAGSSSKERWWARARALSLARNASST